MAGAVAGENAQTLVGYYRAAQTFAFVPYQLILSMTFIVFPMVSRALASNDEDAARRTIQGALRFSMLALLAIACPIAGASDGVMRIARDSCDLLMKSKRGSLVNIASILGSGELGNDVLKGCRRTTSAWRSPPAWRSCSPSSSGAHGASCATAPPCRWMRCHPTLIRSQYVTIWSTAPE